MTVLVKAGSFSKLSTEIFCRNNPVLNYKIIGRNGSGRGNLMGLRDRSSMVQIDF